jgi:hypothetical protein
MYILLIPNVNDIRLQRPCHISDSSLDFLFEFTPAENWLVVCRGPDAAADLWRVCSGRARLALGAKHGGDLAVERAERTGPCGLGLQIASARRESQECRQL